MLPCAHSLLAVALSSLARSCLNEMQELRLLAVAWSFPCCGLDREPEDELMLSSMQRSPTPHVMLSPGGVYSQGLKPAKKHDRLHHRVIAQPHCASMI